MLFYLIVSLIMLFYLIVSFIMLFLVNSVLNYVVAFKSPKFCYK